MISLFYIHFNEAALAERLKQLDKIGLQLSGHWSIEQAADLGNPLAHMFVISLDLLPPYSRQYVQW